MRPRPRWAVPALVVAVLVNVVVLYSPSGPGETVFPGADKIVHVLVFAAVAVTARWVGAPAWLVGVLLVAHAVESELVQHYLLPHRDGDVWDAVADSAGALAGLAVAPLLRRREAAA